MPTDPWTTQSFSCYLHAPLRYQTTVHCKAFIRREVQSSSHFGHSAVGHYGNVYLHTPLCDHTTWPFCSGTLWKGISAHPFTRSDLCARHSLAERSRVVVLLPIVQWDTMEMYICTPLYAIRLRCKTFIGREVQSSSPFGHSAVGHNGNVYLHTPLRDQTKVQGIHWQRGPE